LKERRPRLDRSVGIIMPFNNAAERAIRGIAVGRKNWIFAGSDSGGRRAAVIYTLIETWDAYTECANRDLGGDQWVHTPDTFLQTETSLADGMGHTFIMV
jgi:hypothetical protein